VNEIPQTRRITSYLLVQRFVLQ